MHRESELKLTCIMHRRTFLRGLGVSVALPWLEGMAPRTRAAAATGKVPQRFAFIYTPNGYNQQTFVPKKTGTEWELTPALEPLSELRKEITLCTGLDRTFVGGTGVHAVMMRTTASEASATRYVLAFIGSVWRIRFERSRR